MAGLQRSSETFRRSGSSGLVWEDRFLPGEADSGGGGNNNNNSSNNSKGARGQEERAASSSASVERTRSNGGYRTGRVSPALDPPSPKVSVCGFCTFFGKPRPNSDANSRRRRRR
uniref:MAPK kinase substrate protein At1g80180-like n=1 Tax=Ananas comosus var. bracteatus TaxID=296719 RepID=A0A6V7QTE0_ANACO